jgi:hypothetical protein
MAKDLRALARIAWRRKWLLLLLCAAFALTRGERRTYVKVSPDETYRLEFFTPSVYQRLLHLGMESPGRVRLYRNRDPYDLVRETGVVELEDHGPVSWLQAEYGRVAVGTGVVFRGVHPMSPVGDILPLPVRRD